MGVERAFCGTLNDSEVYQNGVDHKGTDGRCTGMSVSWLRFKFLEGTAAGFGKAADVRLRGMESRMLGAQLAFRSGVYRYPR